MRTWDFASYDRWRGELWKLIGDFADKNVQAAFVKAPPEYVVGDDLSWLDDIVKRVQGRRLDTKSETADRLYGRFDAMRAVHGTRTDGVASFYLNGLLPLVPSAYQERAREIFLGGAFPELTDEDLALAIAAVGEETRAGRVYFDTNERELIGFCGHYMLYGSEYLIAIAAHVGRARDYRQVLKDIGTPTLFVCDVPLSLVSGETLLEFAGMALEYLFRELLEGEEFEPDPHRGGGFSISCGLPPEFIVGHYHPTVTRDPFLLHRIS